MGAQSGCRPDLLASPGEGRGVRMDVENVSNSSEVKLKSLGRLVREA
jgi:hypothetical protein